MSQNSESSNSPEPPEIAKNLIWGWHHIQENWEALTRLPVFIAMVAVGVASYFYGASRSGEEISVKNERIAFLNDQIAAYKDRPQGATPDQAAKQIATLQNRLDASEKKLQSIIPEKVRKLTSSQKELLLSKNDDLLKLDQPIFVYAWTVGDSGEFAWDFVSFLSDQKINTIGQINVNTCRNNEKGIMVGITDFYHPSESAKSFYGILKSAGMSVSYTTWEEGHMQKLTKNDFDLFICPE